MRKKAKVSGSRLKAMGHGMTLEAWDSMNRPDGTGYALLRDKYGELHNESYWNRFNHIPYRWTVHIKAVYYDPATGKQDILSTRLRAEPCFITDLEEVYAAEKKELMQEVHDHGYELIDTGFIARAA